MGKQRIGESRAKTEASNIKEDKKPFLL